MARRIAPNKTDTSPVQPIYSVPFPATKSWQFTFTTLNSGALTQTLVDYLQMDDTIYHVTFDPPRLTRSDKQCHIHLKCRDHMDQGPAALVRACQLWLDRIRLLKQGFLCGDITKSSLAHPATTSPAAASSTRSPLSSYIDPTITTQQVDGPAATE